MTDQQLSAQKYLERLHRLEELLSSNLDELQRLRQISTCISSPKWTETKVMGTHTDEPRFASALIHISDLEKTVEADIAKTIAIRTEVREVINRISNVKEVLVLKYRYIEFLKWEEIARRMSLSKNQIHNIHRNALLKVACMITKKAA